MSEVVDLLKQVLVRLDGIEKDLSDVKKTVDTTQAHVAKFDERLTQLEKVQNLFRPDALDIVAEKLAK